MKQKLSTFVSIAFIVFLPSISFVNGQDKNIPKLHNPFSVSYLKKNLTHSKPRLIYNAQIIKKLKGKIESDRVVSNLYEAIRMAAFEILDMPVIKRDKTTNSMLLISREILRRVNMLCLVYLIEKDHIILDRINQELLSVSEFSDWNPPVYLDVAEISMAVSLALDWTLDDLPDSTIKKAKKALIEKGIYPSWKEHGGNIQHNWWIDHYNNWNQVCNGGMIAASVTVAEDAPELAAKTIKRALDGIPHVLYEDYYPDGVNPEGAGYWNYATSYALLTTSILETAFGSDYGYREYPGFIESATYMLMVSNLTSGWYYNYADCANKPMVDGNINLAWFATETGKSMFYDQEKFLTPPQDIRLSYLTGAALAWICQYEKKLEEKPPSAWIGEGRSPVAVFRGEGENNDYYFGAKGGCGAVSHGNMDAGSFIFELNGVRWSVDPGTQDYLIGEQGFDLWKQCQECERWELLTKNNHGHSTLTVDNKRHVVDGYALVEKYQYGRMPSVTFDLGPTFKGQLKSAFRTFTRDRERSLLIEDEIEPNENTKIVSWQFITQADVEITDMGIILSQKGQKLKLINISHPELKFNIVSLDPPPHKYDKQMDNLKRIELDVPASNFSYNSPFNIQIRLTEAN